MNNLLYYLLYGFCYAISLLPYCVLYAISDIILYPIFFHLVGYRKKVVRKNLQKSFPEKSVKEINEIEKKFYHFFCDYILETLKILSVNKEEFKKRMVMKGVDDMYESFNQNSMLFVYLGHYCNWEYIASLQWWMPDDVQCSQIYSTLRDDISDRFFLKLRSRFGGLNIEKNHSLRIIMDQKRKGEKTVVGFIADQAPRWVNIHLFASFLNQDTPVFTGTERIARKVNASVWVGHITRPRRGFYECQFECITKNCTEEFAENELTKFYLKDLEKQIQENPHLWLWTHKRWNRQRTDYDAPAEWKATIKDGVIISETPIISSKEH